MSKSDASLIPYKLELSAVIDDLAEHFVVFDAEDRVVLANKAWREMNKAVIEFCRPGTKFEDHLRAAIRQGLIPEAAGREEDWLHERMERHRNPRGPFEVARQDGAWILVNEQRLANNETILIISDITELKRAKEGSHESEERFQAFFKNLPAKMHIKDPQGRYILINPVSEKLYGISNEDAIGKIATDIFPEHKGETFDSHDKEVLRTGASVTNEENFTDRGDTKTFLTVKFPIHDAKGDIVAVGASGIDITERKRVEEELREAQRELEDRVERRTQQLKAEIEQRKEIANNLKESEERAIEAREKMRIAKEQAENASGAKTDFMSSMSHELRTPMNAILGFAQLLEMDDDQSSLAEEHKEYVRHIMVSGEHLLNLIDDVLELNKIEAGKLSVSMGRVSVRDVIDECLQQFQLRASSNDIELIDTSSEQQLPWVWSDVTRLKQVLLNIIANAIKYNHKGGSVTLSCKELPGHRLRILVTDTGSGIAQERHDALYLPFDRLGHESGNIRGTGIGLTIVKRIVEMLDGEIDFESVEGKGSTFWIDIPVCEKQDVEDEINPPMKTVDVDPGMIQGQVGKVYSVLYVEDNLANMRLMETIIGRLENMEMLRAYNAEEGIDLAKKHIPDMIMMDINLPGMSGIDALHELKRIKETADIPVIAVSADAMPLDVEKSMQAGFKAYITKPIDVAHTHQVITNILAC